MAEKADTPANMVKIKEERPDDAEINEMAARMIVENRQKMQQVAAQQANAQLRSGILQNQTSLTSYSSKKNGVEIKKDEKEKPMDEDSQRGKFGWATLGKISIPLIIRNLEKYCAVRIAETKILNKYLNILHGDIYNCCNIRSYYITEYEARVLNDVNIRHCDTQFGREPFSARDLVVRFQDACEFYNFLDVCYNKLMLNTAEPSDKCGFIRINGESVVPYTVRNDTKFVPLFYFEGETDSLKEKAENLEGWDLAYLKFCCKVQGIRNELFSSATCSVISLVDIKSYFPAGTVFEDYWPSKVVDSQLLVHKGHGNVNHSWTKQPTGAPMPSSKPISPARSLPATAPVAGSSAAMPVINGWTSVLNGPQYQAMVSQQQQASNIVRMTQVQAQQQAAATTAYTAAMRASRGLSAASYYYPQVQPVLNQHQNQPPPLVRSNNTVSNLAHSTNSYNTNAVPNVNSLQILQQNRTYQSLLKTHQPRLAQNSSNQLNKYAPPPLTSVNGTSHATRYAGYSSAADVMDLSGAQINNKSNKDLSGSKKLVQISEVAPTGSQPLYMMQKALVDSKMVPCINAKPYVYGELLMTLSDLITHFFPNKPASYLQKILQEVLNVTLYRGNNAQLEILRAANKCRTEADMALIQVHDVMRFMAQMKYILEHDSNDQPSKRQRTS